MGPVVKNLPTNAGDIIKEVGSTPGSRRSPGEENGNRLQYSCLENPKDREAWWATVHGVTKSWTRLKRLRTVRRGHGTAKISTGYPSRFRIQILRRKSGCEWKIPSRIGRHVKGLPWPSKL